MLLLKAKLLIAETLPFFLFMAVPVWLIAEQVQAQEPPAEQPAQIAVPSGKFTLVMTTDEIQLVGKALGKLPYEDVSPLIFNLQQQIQKQQKPVAPVQPEKSKK